MNWFEDGYRGIWYFNQPQPDEYRFKYSGGFATYPQQHIPLAGYSSRANKTFFCYGGRKKERNELLNMVAYYDHSSGTVSRPVVVLSRTTSDAHYNPTLALDDRGYIYVFCNSHGSGYELDEHDPTFGQSYIYRSVEPYAIDGFIRLRADTFSYSQVWPLAGQGLFWFHTRYIEHQRRLFWSASADGHDWSAPRQLTHMQRGNYQISWKVDDRIVTVFDYHPQEGGLNARTNIYYLETRDAGGTWRDIEGRPVATPLTDVHNPALVHDFEREGLLVYLKDLHFDAADHPVILYLTSRGPWSGPASGPRTWHTLRWTGATWEQRQFVGADHNYDHGSLYIEADGTWRIIAPTEPGPQPHSTGGEITVHESSDQGTTWHMTQRWRIDNQRNQTYVRKPAHAHPDFYAFWADGHALEPSESYLYFATKDGRIYRLPPTMTSDFASPELVVDAHVTMQTMIGMLTTH